MRYFVEDKNYQIHFGDGNIQPEKYLRKIEFTHAVWFDIEATDALLLDLFARLEELDGLQTLKTYGSASIHRLKTGAAREREFIIRKIQIRARSVYSYLNLEVAPCLD